MSNKIALFDFCETLADFQTADAFVRYAEKKIKNVHLSAVLWYRVLSKTKILAVLHRIFSKQSIGKRLLLRRLKGTTKTEMDRIAREYYNTVIRDRLISRMMDVLQLAKVNGFDIYIVSGGYDIYLKYFAEVHGIKGVIASTLEFKDGIFSGKLSGKDCMYENKIKRILQEIPYTNYSDWRAYSDSISDIPMLKLVGNPFVVSRNRPQEWAKELGFPQIVWEE